MINDPRGSNWRKWDLHVHTPDSIINDYPGHKEAAWEAFLTDLENLPDEYRVLGINDYIFLDGYRRVLAERAKGRLPNIDAVFPVVELRLDMFGGRSEDKLKRINYHVLFSNEVAHETLQSQFINGLKKSYYLDSGSKSWDSIPTVASLTSLGKEIYEATPADKRNQFPSSMAELGFNNLNFNLETIRTLLQNPDFNGKHLTALGRNEWASFPWNDQFIADKKSLIQHVDFVLGASKTVEEYNSCRTTLGSQGVNDRLIQASDAHALSTATDKPNRIGNGMTWIKADTSFRGLKQALKRFDDRIYVGDLPPKEISVRDNPTKYINKISVTKTSAIEETWFENTSVPLNHGLAVIIGNKGSAKSALTDIVALVGNVSCDPDHYSFLHKTKFHAKPEAKSKHFSAELEWNDGKSHALPLNAQVDPDSDELVKYIPQDFFESVCNEIAQGKFERFDSELGGVIFSHVSQENRLGKKSLKQLLEHKTSEIDSAIGQLRTDLEKVNKEIASLEDRLSPPNKKSIENKRDARVAELATHRATKPDEVVDPSTTGDETAKATAGQLADKARQVKVLEGEIAEQIEAQAKSAIDESNVEKARGKIELLNNYLERTRVEFDQLELTGVTFDKIVTVKVEAKALDDFENQLNARKTSIAGQLDDQVETSLLAKKGKLEADIAALQQTLDAPNKLYQGYLRALRRWEKKELEILKDRHDDSIWFFESQLAELKTLPGEVKKLEATRTDIVQQIFGQIEKKVQQYRTLYAVVQDFIQHHPLANEFNLEFDVSIVNDGFYEDFADFIDQGNAGTFYGRGPGKEQADKILEKHDFNLPADAARFPQEILENLQVDNRDKVKTINTVAAQLKGSKTPSALYDFLFGLTFLRPRFVLKMLGKDMNQLSPGEKGTVLLVFYLLIDKGDIPLIIDQPEENLDNETIVKLLVPAITEAKNRRQVIIVTHNPNLAVVCDAEQVIRAHIHKTDKNRVEYVTGSIENPRMNTHLVDVLEGTSRAFKIRSGTYELR